MQDIWKLKKTIAFGQPGTVYSDQNDKTTWRLLHWKQKEQVRLLKCIRTVCNLANFVDYLLKSMVQMVSMGMLVPTLFH